MKKVRIFLMVLAVVVLAAGTVFERYRGAEWVADHFYGSWWFAVLLGLVAVAAIVAIVQRRLWHRPASLLIHASIPIILLGGALTTWTGEHYSITLAPGETKEGITLERFEVLYYPGTHTPMDFVSHVTANGEPFDISMNHILRHDGRRYYQEDYDDEGSTTLSVSHDPWGIPVTYTGYALLLIGLGWLCLQQKPRQGRQTLAVGVSPRDNEGKDTESHRGDTKPAADVPPLQGSNRHNTPSVGSRPRLKTIVPLGLLLILNFQLSIFNSAQAAPKTLPRETASKMGEMYTLYKGRICPLQTFAKDFTTKLTGKATYQGLSSEQVLSGFLFYYGDWAPLLDQVKPKRQKESKALVEMLLSGRGLKLFPVSDSTGVLGWYAQNDDLPLTVSDDEYLFIRKHLSYCQELVVKGDYAALEQVFEKIKLFQEKRASNVLPSPTRVKAERLYNALTTGRWLAMLTLTLGLLCFAYSLWCQGRGKTMPRWLKVALTSYLLVLTSYLLLIFVLRWIAGGHIPMAGGFDSMNLMAIAIGIIGLGAQTSSSAQGMRLPIALLTMGFCLLVAMMSGSNPPVTNLMPVLSSPPALPPCRRHHDVLRPLLLPDDDRYRRINKRQEIFQFSIFNFQFGKAPPLSCRLPPRPRHHHRRPLGQHLLGQLLDLGPQGSLGAHHPHRLRLPHAPLPENQTQPQSLLPLLLPRLPQRHHHLLRRQLPPRRPPRLRQLTLPYGTGAENPESWTQLSGFTASPVPFYYLF